jgi:hypothetical protein
MWQGLLELLDFSKDVVPAGRLEFRASKAVRPAGIQQQKAMQ